MPSASPSKTDPFLRVGNHLAADFANTAYSPDNSGGSIHNARDVVAFLVATGALANADATELRRSLTDDKAAQRFFKRAVQLRTAVAEALKSIDRRSLLSDATLHVLNDTLRADAGHERLERIGKTRVELVHHRSRSDLEYALAPIARAAAELLASADAPVRKCANPVCTRYFYDDSRTRRRRWCEMAVCGNRAKMMAFVERKRADRSKKS